MKSKEKMVDEDDWDVKNERNGNAEKRNKGMVKKGRPTAKNGKRIGKISLWVPELY